MAAYYLSERILKGTAYAVHGQGRETKDTTLVLVQNC
ncbi:hypothetical protein HALDL1_04905 [Halobacterium sp. DL1]|nr:hypothetical protein HALDL1_04905 [Halobacterium sp. DL1]